MSRRPPVPLFVESLETRRLLATFTVNNGGDVGTGTGTTASRTLRQAINAANATTTADTIVFNLPRLVVGGATRSYSQIKPTSPLPTIIYPVTIDGGDGDTTQTVGLEIDGVNAGASASGLLLDTGSCTLRDLAIVNFGGDGVVMGLSSVTGGNVVTRCHFGVDADGVLAEGNGRNGLVVNSSNNTIGGLGTDDRNVFGGNAQDGIIAPGGGNVFVNNHVGVNYFGSTVVANGGNGITLRSSNNRVGAATATQGGVAARNVISGNALDGVHVEQIAFLNSNNVYQFGANADNNVIAGNYIGTNRAGEADFGNGGSGVRIINGESNTVGSADTNGRNVISGNAGRGVTVTAVTTDSNTLGVSQNNAIIGNYIGLSATGLALGNGSAGITLEENQNGLTSFVQNNRIGGTAAGEGNVISSNASSGISVQLNAGTTTIQGNTIGLDPAGTAARANGVAGVIFNNAAGNLLGGPGVAARNVISGNTGDGVRIITTTTSSGSADSNTVTNNYIGTNAGGTAAVANTQYGVRVIGGSGNVIGDSRIDTGNAGNLVSGNTAGGIALGIDVSNFTERGSTANTTIQNNYVGPNAAGTAAIGNNTVGGIIIAGTTAVPTTNTSVGGAGTGVNAKGNQIVGANFLTTGLDVRTGATGTSVLGNRIGTNNAGTAQLGALQHAVILGGTNTAIGSTAAGGGNTIGFATYGVRITGPEAFNISILGNAIGTNATGTIDLGNTFGVYVDVGTNNVDHDITIGGTAAGSANRIADNLYGVAVTSGKGIEIVGNRISDNDNLGIDLNADGVTPNDIGGVDDGPNSLQNFPVVSVVNPAGPTAASVTVTGAMVNAAAGSTVRLDFYAVVTPDATGYGEGDLYLGSANVTTNGSGNASTTQTFSLGGLPNATAITATATFVATGSTSEFSLASSLIDVTAPAAVGTVYDFVRNPPALRIGFTENVGASLTASDFVLRNLTPATPTTVPTANIAVAFDASTNTAVLTFPGYPRNTLPDGSYRVTIAAGRFADVNGNTNTAAYAGDFFVLAGDIDRDRGVSINDFNLFAANFGKAAGQTFLTGDFDYDGGVSINDFNLLSANFGKILPAPAALPQARKPAAATKPKVLTGSNLRRILADTAIARRQVSKMP